jgi:hypothetical protein
VTLRLTAARFSLALTPIAVQVSTRAGAADTYVAAAGGGNRFLHNGRVRVKVKNAGGGAITVTFKAQAACSHGFLEDQVTSIPAGQEYGFGPFDTTWFNDPTTGYVWILYSGVSSVTVAAVQI